MEINVRAWHVQNILLAQLLEFHFFQVYPEYRIKKENFAKIHLSLHFPDH